jgi:hypothetical protein
MCCFSSKHAALVSTDDLCRINGRGLC